MFWTTVATAFNQTIAHAFALHGQGIADYANGDEIDLVPWLQRTLVKAGFDLVLTYDLAQGITFPNIHVFVDPPESAELQDGVVVINTGRGKCINAEDMVDALHSGKVSIYATDVWPSDPPPPDYPLLKAPNVIMTPHIGASTRENLHRIGDQVVEIIKDFVK